MPRNGVQGARAPREWPVVIVGSEAARVRTRDLLRSMAAIQVLEPDEAAACGTSSLILCLERIPPSNHELKQIREYHSAGSRIICTASGMFQQSLGERCKLLLAGADELFDEAAADYPASLRSTIETIVREENKSFDELQLLKAHMSEAGIAGTSAALTDAFRLLERVAPFSDLPVLITGETGTGKELFAKAIHDLDTRRRSAPFVAVNCGSLPEALWESEMFGFRRGAFTGADRDRPGLFRTAHLGVLFLDEIGELSMAAQTKLLRVIQTRRVLPVGADAETEVDVRVLAATNRDLEEMVRQGTFREDLYHRINVLHLSLPPLRDRPEDIEPLVEYIAFKHRDLSRGLPIRFTREFLSAIQETTLPGNVRQLENLIRKALLSADGRRALSLQDLPKDLWNELANASPSTPEAPSAKASLREIALQCLEQNGWNLARSMELFERELLNIALEASNGNQSEAARRLGITPRSVYNKLHQHTVAVRQPARPQPSDPETHFRK